LLVVPMYFLETRVGLDTPPPVTHPEFYYGFIGVALAWQVAFLLIARDPKGLRIMMLPAVLEKLSYGLTIPILFGQGRVAMRLLPFAALDLAFGLLFLVAYFRTANK